MKKMYRACLLLAASLIVSSCAGGMAFTKPTELPEEKIARLADQIEEAVMYTEVESPMVSDFDVDEESGELVGDIEPLSMIVDMEEIRQKIPALAELNVDDEVMLAAIRGRIFRWPAIREFRRKGCIGESREGFAQNMKSEKCGGDRTERDRVAHIVLQENRNRRVIYERLVQANGWSHSTVGRVRELFAGKIYEKAWAGTPLQTPEGTWERK